MKKLLLVGGVGCGKTTLLQRLEGRDIAYAKTGHPELGKRVYAEALKLDARMPEERDARAALFATP